MAVEQYPLAIRWLHRIIALLMIGMIALGWYLSEMDYEAPDYIVLRQLHRTIGLALFPLGVAHLLAYSFLPRPALAANLKPWEKSLAKLVHMFLLYVVIAIPVAGYFMSGNKLVVLGDITVPALIELTKNLRSALFDIHESLAWTAAAIIGLHSAAALKHHFIDKDDTLKKML
ncbi:MAG TPA: cytochrome b [Pseudomonadales bacterium]|nr:cytochrome b [Pseudomonadales bacterium]